MTGLDRISGIQNTEKYKYYEYMRYMGNINYHRVYRYRFHLRLLVFLSLALIYYYLYYFSILDTTNTVQTCHSLYLNKEIYFAKPLKMSQPGATRQTILDEAFTLPFSI